MVRKKLKKSKQRASLVRSVSSMILGSSKIVNDEGLVVGESVRNSVEGPRELPLQKAPKQDSSILKAMQSIIHSQQDEIIKQLEASSDLKNDLKASEKRVDLLKDTIEDFANALYSCRDETRELDRQRRKLEAENQELRDETPSKPLAQSIATFTLQQQAATYEREMRALVSQISAARDDVAQQYSEIAALNKTLAAVSIHSSELARRNEFLSQDNTDLHQRISELDCSKDMTLNSATSQSNGTEFAAGGGSTREEQPVVRGFTHISTGRLVSDGHR